MQISDRIGRRMKLDDLHVLMEVVNAGSMRKAAALLTRRNLPFPGRSPTSNRRSAPSSSTATRRASSRHVTGTHCSGAGLPLSMSSSKACGTSSSSLIPRPVNC